MTTRTTPAVAPKLPARTRRWLFGTAAALVLGAHLVYQFVLWDYAPAPLSPARQWSIFAVALVLLAGYFLRKGRGIVCYALMTFLISDLGIGVLSYILSHGKLPIGANVPDLLPSRFTRSTEPWAYHPILGIVNRPNFSGRYRPSTGGPFLLWQHDSHGYRRALPISPDRPLVVVMGGSTTYDMTHPNVAWVDRLEQMDSGPQYANAGVVGYSSVEHVIQTAFYLPSPPSVACAVYYLGWNDLWRSFVPLQDAAQADLYYVNGLRPPGFRRPSGLGSPILSLLIQWTSALVGDTRSIDTSGLPPRSGVDARTVALLRRNVETIADINRGRGIPSVFIGQVLNQEQLEHSDNVPGASLLQRDRDALIAMGVFNEAIAEAAHRKGATYVDVSARLFVNADFVDEGHFSAQGSNKFATLVWEGVHRGCFGR